MAVNAYDDFIIMQHIYLAASREMNIFMRLELNIIKCNLGEYLKIYLDESKKFVVELDAV